MTGLRRHSIIVCLACGVVCAQEATRAPSPSKLDQYMETGMEVEGVRAPYYDDDGVLRAQLHGGHAKVLENSVAEITHIRIDVFDDGVEYMTVYAPKCLARVVEKNGRKSLAVESDGDVLIEMEETTITGRGFRFSSDSNRFEILSEARVLVKQSARDAKGVEL